MDTAHSRHLSDHRCTPRLALAAIALLLAACGSPTEASQANPVEVELFEWGIQLDQQMTAGETGLTVKNDGTLVHEMMLIRTDASGAELPIVAGRVDLSVLDEDDVVILETDHLDPDATAMDSLQLEPGHYIVLCNLPGHYEAGMWTEVQIPDVAG